MQSIVTEPPWVCLLTYALWFVLLQYIPVKSMLTAASLPLSVHHVTIRPQPKQMTLPHLGRGVGPPATTLAKQRTNDLIRLGALLAQPLQVEALRGRSETLVRKKRLHCE